MRRARVLAAQAWTEQALVLQLNVMRSIMQNAQVDLKHLSAQCLLLSKILDSLVANNRLPVWRQEILPVVKQVLNHKENPDMRPALLILLMSVKNAFRTEWSSLATITERDEILATLKSLYESYTSDTEASGNAPVQFLLQTGGSAVKDIQETRAHLDIVSSRFCPRLQFNSIFVAAHAKVGYEVIVCDFHIPHMHRQDRVRLHVGQIDTETSMCLVTPPQVNILVNGCEVERRVTVGYVDVGPQMPSDVTSMVRVGQNILQVIGEFSVPYIIAVTSSRTIERSAKTTELEEYVAPTRAASEIDPNEADDEVVEGASRVSLRCPVSHQRLVTPVKASTCRHLQCFDYDSFLEINEKRPAWRCPCCNRLTSCPDLRIDRRMEKVLKETDVNIHEVIFYQDGSWVPVSTVRDQDDVGHVSIIEGSEIGEKVIDLSDEEEPVNGAISRKIGVFQQQEQKPDPQILQDIISNRGVPSQPTNPVVPQPDTVRRLVISVPEPTTLTPQSSPSFAGPARIGVNRSNGAFVNVSGGVLFSSTTGTVEMQVQNQPAPSVQSLSAVNHNFQVTFAQSRTVSHMSSPGVPVNRPAQNRGYIPSAQLQQPQTGASSNPGQVNQGENRWVRQRQPGQQPAGTSQDLDQTRPQWRSTGVSQPQNAQQFYTNQMPVSNSQRQQRTSPVANSYQLPNLGRSPQVHQQPSPGATAQQQPNLGRSPQVQQQPSPGATAQQQPNLGRSPQMHQQPSPGATVQQQPNLGRSPQTHQQPSPGVTAQQRSGSWGGSHVGQWHSSISPNQAQASPNAGGSEQNWRPAGRMRGSIVNPSLGRGGQGSSSPALQLHRVQVASSGNAFPSTQFNTAPEINVSTPTSFSYYDIDTVLGNQVANMPVHANQAANVPVADNPAANVSLYNGTTWVNGSEFSSAPLMFSGVQTSGGWIPFQNMPGQLP